MNAEIVAIGSELLLGQIVDSNSAWISRRLAENGINLFFKTIVGDNHERMNAILKNSLERADIVITSGGIGPTKDDITRDIVAKVTNRNLLTDQESLNDIEERFRKRGFIPTKNNDRQAMFPEGSIIIKNPNGTAPSFIVEEKNKSIICLPGVPFEMKWLVENEVIPYLRKRYELNEIIHYKVLKTIDLGESNVDHLIGDIIEKSKNPTVGVLAHPGQVDVRIAAKAKNKKEADLLINPVKKEITSLLKDAIFGEDGETLEKNIGKLLSTNNTTISTIENISGGAISEAFQNSTINLYSQGITMGANNNMINLFKKYDVNLDDSDPIKIALSQAYLIKKISSSNIGLAYYGIASGELKVENLGKGESYFAIVSDSGYDTKHIRSAGIGAPDKRRAVMNALSLARKFLINK
tara:strand:+ start:169 stop:1398 length:1230 start_codon:yes stop_codon:yes gene_type:complete